VFAAVPDLLGEDERITPFAAHMLAHVFADAVPLKVAGDVEYLINRTAKGWIVTLLNGNGVFKPQQGMAQVDRNAAVTVTIAMGNGKTTVQVPPGGLTIVEILAADEHGLDPDFIRVTRD
jgi:hypothetical protein